MRLIDLDQTVFVPIVDESKGGVSYEMQMSLAEFFDKFLNGFKPEVVDAIPIDWLRDRMQSSHATITNPFGFVITNPFGFVLAEWLDEQEAEK